MRRGFTVIEFLAVLAVLLILVSLLTGVLDFAWSIGWHLLTGWAYYLGRTLPQLRPNPAEFAVAGVALVILIVGCHRIGRGLAGPGWRRKWTLQAVGLLVLLFACGTAAVGVTHQAGWLVRSPAPLTESTWGMQGVVGRTNAMNNLKQLGLAAHNRADAHESLPAPTFTPDGRPLHSWHTHLLPYLEQEELYRRLDRTKPWADPVNRPAVETRVKTFQRADPSGDLPADPAVTHFAPNARLFDRPRRVAELPLGASNTVLAAEAHTAPRPWADPLNCRDPRRPLGSAGGFAGVRGQPVLVGMTDGSVRAVTQEGWAAVMRGEPSPED